MKSPELTSCDVFHDSNVHRLQTCYFIIVITFDNTFYELTNFKKIRFAHTFHYFS